MTADAKRDHELSTTEEWQEIGARLRELRLAAGLTGKQLADRHGWQQSKVSRIETGGQTFTAADVQAWVEAAGAPAAVADELIAQLERTTSGHRDWKRRMRRGPAAVQASYTKLVADASFIAHFETVYVPGLLQTSEYAARAIGEVAGMAEAPTPDIAAAVATRMQRQQALYDPGKRFEFLLLEPVLRLLICPPQVMRVQLDRLQTVIGLPNVRFGIIPLGVELGTTPQNSFQLYGDTAVVETFVGEWTHRPEDSATYAHVLERLWADAVEGDAARRLIVAAQESLP